LGIHAPIIASQTAFQSAESTAAVFLADVMSPTGLAVDNDGNVYVASLFGEGAIRIGCSGEQTVS
jgi:hypothetical protein